MKGVQVFVDDYLKKNSMPPLPDLPPHAIIAQKEVVDTGVVKNIGNKLVYPESPMLTIEELSELPRKIVKTRVGKMKVKSIAEALWKRDAMRLFARFIPLPPDDGDWNLPLEDFDTKMDAYRHKKALVLDHIEKRKKNHPVIMTHVDECYKGKNGLVRHRVFVDDGFSILMQRSRPSGILESGHVVTTSKPIESVYVEPESQEAQYRTYRALEVEKGGYFTFGGKPLSRHCDFKALRVFHPTLLGGGKRKGKKKTNKKRRNGTSMVSCRQEGSINTWVRSDPVVKTTMRYNGILTADGSGVIQARFSLRNPTRAQNGAGSYTGAAQFGVIYDEYKVTRFVFQYEPLVAVGTNALGPLYCAFDYDSTDQSNQSLTNISEYGNYGNFDSRKAFEITSKIPALTSGEAFDINGDSDAAVPIHRGGYMDFADPPINGCMFIAGDNFPASAPIGRVVCTMHILLRRRR